MESTTLATQLQATSKPRSPKSMSFSRFDAPRGEAQARSRASTLQGPIPEIMLQPNNFSSSPEEKGSVDGGDPFSHQDEDEEAILSLSNVPDMPQRFEDLPIEIRTLTERFLESLTAKVHPTPLAIDALSKTFQEFYIRAETHISTHIAALSSRLSRDRPVESVQARVSRAVNRKSSGNSVPQEQSTPATIGGRRELQMVSTSELLDKRKARRILELKRVALEEAVERAVCEKLYSRLYHHRSTDDRERDQKLRSRVAALSVVGIGLKELLVTGTTEDLSPALQTRLSEDEDRIKGWLAPARKSMKLLSEARYPAAKILHLTEVHKSIVETLSRIFPASSSADEILPTLIYTLITIPPSEINAISDLNFIQRFRASTRVDGETAYCLVNLEAAITFLETVDLPSLRKNERSQGPEKSARPDMMRVDSAPMQLGITPVKNSRKSLTKEDLLKTTSQPPASPTRNPRRLSALTQPFQSGAARLEAASDSFRNAMLDGADQTLDMINSTVDNSFRFIFGRLKEQQTSRNALGSSGIGSITDPKTGAVQAAASKESLVEMPKTLEDARKLVSPATPSDDLLQLEADPNDNLSMSDKHSDAQSDAGSGTLTKSDSSTKILDLFGGRRQMRDQSVDSSRSGLSGTSVTSASKKLAPLKDASDPLSASPTTQSPVEGRFPTSVKALQASLSSPASSTGPANTVESLRGLGNTLNPFNRIPAVGGLFGRSPVTTPATATGPTFDRDAASEVANAAAVSSAKLKGLVTSSSNKRFVDAKSGGELKVGEVDELLKAYQALVAAARNVVGN